MKTKNNRKPIVLLASFWGALLAQGVEPAESKTPPESPASVLAGKYQPIIDRNPFNIQPPPPPPPKVETPKKETVPLKQLNLVLAGVSGRNGEKRAWLAMTLPPSHPEQKPVQRYFSFRENEEQHGIIVKTIQSNGDVDIEYEGEPMLLTFETHGNKTKAPSKKSPSKNNRSTEPVAKNRANNKITAIRSSNPTSSSGRSIVSTQTRSTRRPVRTQSNQPNQPSQPRLTRNQQVVSMQMEKAAADLEGVQWPPPPPFGLREE